MKMVASLFDLRSLLMLYRPKALCGEIMAAIMAEIGLLATGKPFLGPPYVSFLLLGLDDRHPPIIKAENR